MVEMVIVAPWAELFVVKINLTYVKLANSRAAFLQPQIPVYLRQRLNEGWEILSDL